jgi:hypothetical protein
LVLQVRMVRELMRAPSSAAARFAVWQQLQVQPA